MRRDFKLIFLLMASLVWGGGYFAQQIASVMTKAEAQEAKPATQAKQTLPGKMVFDVEGKYTEFAGDKGKTDFDHDQHVKAEKKANADKSCAICHHTNSDKLTDKLEEPVSKCTLCHKGDDGVSNIEGVRPGVVFKGKTAINAKDAFHGNDSIIGCIGCHKERMVEPSKCTNCHLQ